MIITIVAIILNLFDVVSRDENHVKLPSITRKIVGGRDCSTDKYPFVVSLRKSYSFEHFCGGSLIREDWVLTVAHCVTTMNPYHYIVTSGTSGTREDGVQRKMVQALFVHPKFSKRKKEYDIALLLLNEPFDLSANSTATVALPPSEIQGDVRERCGQATVTGWGHNNQWDPHGKPLDYVFNPILQCISIPVLADQECIEIQGEPLTKNTVCAYFQNGTRDACQGDSGGPLFCEYTLYGLVSFGYGCALPGRPGYYTRVDKYLDFIEHITSNNKRSASIRMRSRAFKKSKFILDLTYLSMVLLFMLLGLFK